MSGFVAPSRPAPREGERLDFVTRGFLSPTNREVRVAVPSRLLVIQVERREPVNKPILCEILLVVGTSRRHRRSRPHGLHHFTEDVDATSWHGLPRIVNRANPA
jgi:hypothetical protein